MHTQNHSLRVKRECCYVPERRRAAREDKFKNDERRKTEVCPLTCWNETQSSRRVSEEETEWGMKGQQRESRMNEGERETRKWGERGEMETVALSSKTSTGMKGVSSLPAATWSEGGGAPRGLVLAKLRDSNDCNWFFKVPTCVP